MSEHRSQRNWTIELNTGKYNVVENVGGCRVGVVAVLPDLAHATIFVRARERQKHAREHKPDLHSARCIISNSR
jgi:hypothetical protein